MIMDSTDDKYVWRDVLAFGIEFDHTYTICSYFLDDIVGAMVDIDSGGIRGLIELGLVEKREKDKCAFEDVRLAFQTWYDFLDEHLIQ